MPRRPDTFDRKLAAYRKAHGMTDPTSLAPDPEPTAALVAPVEGKGTGEVACCGHRRRCLFGAVHRWTTAYRDGAPQPDGVYECDKCGAVCVAEAVEQVPPTASADYGSTVALGAVFDPRGNCYGCAHSEWLHSLTAPKGPCGCCSAEQTRRGGEQRG